MNPLQRAIERYNAALAETQRLGTEWETARDVESPTDEQRAGADDAFTAYEASVDQLDAAEREVTNLEHLERQRARTPREVAEPAARQGAGRGEGRERITVIEHPVYERFGPHSFLRDAYLSSGISGSPAPREVLERIERHQAQHRDLYDQMQERAASTTTNFAGLVVPQYLTDMVAPLARAMRPVADICTAHDLPPDGMEVDISRITTGTTATEQATQGTAFATQAIDDTLLTVPVFTVGGYVDLSVQAVMRGRTAEQVTMADLLGAYATDLDTLIISGSGSSGQPLGITQVSGIGAVTYTDASPTVAEIWPKLADGKQRVNAALYALGRANVIVLAPRRYGWFEAALDSNNRPLLVDVSMVQAFNAMGAADGPASYGNTGVKLAGLPVVEDGNISLTQGAGTEDSIIIGNRNEWHLWEDPNSPMLMRFEQPVGHQGQVRIVAFGFAAFTAGRYPAATSVVSGTGLIAPTF